jgi:type IV pilus assembly protein PilO
VYYYRYKVGTISYPTNYTQGYIFEPGEELEIQIFSADRLDETDVSGLDLSIINETDMVVNIVYYSEDFEDPRLALTSEGPVAIH